MKFIDDFFKRFAAEITHFKHIFFGFFGQILDGVNTCAFQAVVRTNAEVKVLDGHFKHFLLFVVVLRNENIVARHIVDKVDEKLNVVVHDFCRKADDFLCGNGAVCKDFDRQFVKVDALLDTGALDSVVCF